MKLAKSAIGRAIDAPDATIRFYLFHGPDQGQSRALGARLVQAMSANRFVVISNNVRSDPASLADEARAMTLFGGKRVIWLEPTGEEIADGVAALLDAPGSESPVVAISGALRRGSALLKLAELSREAIAYASYLPDGQEAERMVVDIARRFGLKVSSQIAARVATASSNDQAIVAQELEKFALYVGASPNEPKELYDDAVDAVGAESSDGDFLRLTDLALAGEMGELVGELGRLAPGGTEVVPTLRALQRRLLMLAPARARVEAGESIGSVMASLGKTLFWKDKSRVAKMLSQWTASDLAKIAERSSRLERQSMFTAVPPSAALGEELLAIARAGTRR